MTELVIEQEKLEQRQQWNNYAAKRREKRRSEGLCQVCGKNTVAEGGRNCDDCRARNRQYMRDKGRAAVMRGMCRQCKRSKSITATSIESNTAHRSAFCMDCYTERKAIQHYGDKEMAEYIRQAWYDQEGRCSFTGQPLVIGQGATYTTLVADLMYSEEAGEWVTRAIASRLGALEKLANEEEREQKVRVLYALRENTGIYEW